MFEAGDLTLKRLHFVAVELEPNAMSPRISPLCNGTLIMAGPPGLFGRVSEVVHAKCPILIRTFGINVPLFKVEGEFFWHGGQ